MNILKKDITDKDVLKLFSLHDDYMIEFLGDDKCCYTRYSDNENIEGVWVVYCDNHPIGCVSYRKKLME